MKRGVVSTRASLPGDLLRLSLRFLDFASSKRLALFAETKTFSECPTTFTTIYISSKKCHCTPQVYSVPSPLPSRTYRPYILPFIFVCCFHTPPSFLLAHPVFVLRNFRSPCPFVAPDFGRKRRGRSYNGERKPAVFSRFSRFLAPSFSFLQIQTVWKPTGCAHRRGREKRGVRWPELAAGAPQQPAQGRAAANPAHANPRRPSMEGAPRFEKKDHEPGWAPTGAGGHAAPYGRGTSGTRAENRQVRRKSVTPPKLRLESPSTEQNTAVFFCF